MLCWVVVVVRGAFSSIVWHCGSGLSEKSKEWGWVTGFRPAIAHGNVKSSCRNWQKYESLMFGVEFSYNLNSLRKESPAYEKEIVRSAGTCRIHMLWCKPCSWQRNNLQIWDFSSKRSRLFCLAAEFNLPHLSPSSCPLSVFTFSPFPKFLLTYSVNFQAVWDFLVLWFARKKLENWNNNACEKTDVKL